jgi:hypothetical protein
VNRIRAWSLRIINQYSLPVPPSGMDPSSADDSDDLRCDAIVTCPWSFPQIAHLWTLRSRPNEIFFNVFDSRLYQRPVDLVYEVYALRLNGVISGDRSSIHNSELLTNVAKWTIPRDQTDPTGNLSLKGMEGIIYRHQFSGYLHATPTHTFSFLLDPLFNSMFDGGMDHSLINVTSLTLLDSHYISALCSVSGRILYSKKSGAFDPATLYLVDYLC